MLKYGILKVIFFTSLAVGVLCLAINIYWAYPSYSNLLIENTEDEAIRMGRHLGNETYDENGNLIDPERLKAEAREFKEGFKLM